MKKSIQEPILKGFSKYSIKFVNNLKRVFKKINENTYNITIEEQLEKMTKLAKRQQEMIEEMITKEEFVFSHVSKLMQYKALSQRGLSFMAGGHEICGLFNSLDHIFRTNKDLQPYNKDIKRLGDIFEGQMYAGNACHNNYRVYKTKNIIDHFSNIYKNNSKEIIFTDSFINMEMNPHIRQNVMITIIGNLISNALYFSTKVVIDYVDGKIVVSDNGRGIKSVRDQDNLFSFGWTQKSHGGHGAGLFLCREMAREVNLELSFVLT